MKKLRRPKYDDTITLRLPVSGESYVTVRRLRHPLSKNEEMETERRRKLQRLRLNLTDAEKRIREAGEEPMPSRAKLIEEPLMTRLGRATGADEEFRKYMEKDGRDAINLVPPLPKQIDLAVSLISTWKGDIFDETPADTGGAINEDMIRRVWFGDPEDGVNVVPRFAKVDEDGNVLDFVWPEDPDLPAIQKIAAVHEASVTAIKDDILAGLKGQVHEVVWKVDELEKRVAAGKDVGDTEAAGQEQAQKVEDQLAPRKAALLKLQATYERKLKKLGVKEHPYQGITFHEFFCAFIRDAAVEAEEQWMKFVRCL